MKSLHHFYTTKEKKEKLTSVGESFTTGKTYTKDDFLTPGKVAKKLNISTEIARQAMKKLQFKQAVFLLNGHKSRVIVNLGKNGPYLHPMALNYFQEYVDNQKAK